MRRIALALIGFLALAGVIGYTATSGVLTGNDDTASRGVAGTAPSIGIAEGGSAIASSPDEAAADQVVSSDGSVSQFAVLPEIGSSVIRTGTIAIEVKTGGFGRAFDTASLIAARYGGYVQSSSMAGTKQPSGELLLRIPAERFDEAVSDLRALGTPEQQSVSSEDVSAQFVDLEARLRTWQSQEAVLLDLMGQATTIEATIRVQSELQDVQMRIEEIKGQLNLLNDRTDFATIQVSLYEPGTAIALSETDPSRPSLAEAWQRALDGFLGVCYSVVVGLGYLVPIAAIAGLFWLGYRRLRAPRPASPAA